MTQYQIPITLTILGPFLTAATGPDAYGMNKAFHRDGHKNPVIPDRHIKGKLRMALEELLSVTGSELPIDIKAWFGALSEEGSYEPAPGSLSFSHFKLENDNTQAGARTRTAINVDSGTAAEKQLRKVEDLFASGSDSKWEGSVTFYAADEVEASQIRTALLMGFIWLTNLGAEKGVGFGRISQVQVGDPAPVPPADFNPVSLGASSAMNLRIQPVEQIMIGGVKQPGTNFVRSERVIPGAAIKGALAASLNLAHGRAAHLPLSSEAASDMPGFEQLVGYFDRIRVTHAFPTYLGDPRPVKMPLSTVKAVSNKLYDRALNPDADLLINKVAPTYFIDWKTPQEFVQAASPKEIFVTRTEIEDTTRRSQEQNLFTYSCFLPEDGEGNPVEWVCNVNFDAIEDNDIRRRVRDQFGRAVAQYLNRLGKLTHAVNIVIGPGAAPPAEGSREDVKRELIITLQSDAIMLNPDDVRLLRVGEDLFALYADYWEEISAEVDSVVCLELTDFFAHQNFQGGYLYHRYLGAGERNYHPNQYYPYYLTGAGSVFRLRVLDEKAAQHCVDRWLSRGLDLPVWATQKYSQYDRALWQNCPFVPENGYGEVAINLKWHWDKQPSEYQTRGE